MAVFNPRPVIKDLQPGDWIDLDKLGADPLLTYIKYDNIKIGDVLWPNWRGCGANGEVVDHAEARVDVTEGGGYTPELGMPVSLLNSVVNPLDQGWAFYSYALGSPVDPDFRGDESLRLFCYVGKRVAKNTGLPVPQIQQSHDLALDPDAITSAGATAVVPPYRAMSVADKVIFTWQGHVQGSPDNPYRETKVLRAEDLGQPLTFTVPYTEVIGIAGEHADISYRVEYVEGAGLSSDSDRQTLQIVAPVSSPLPAITIKNYGGGPINPGHYPDGLVLQVKPVYAGIQEGDWVLVYWKGSDKARSVTKAQRVDRSTLDSGLIEFLIEPRWLADNSNAQVTVGFQFAREGAALSAVPLQVDISKPLYLPAPIVDGATAEAGGDNGRLEASTSGAYVNVPDTAEVGSGKVEMHWQGHPNGGRHIALTPVGGNDKRYFIPPSAIAANMSTQEQARFPVFYKVFPSGDAVGEDSGYFNLRITPLPASRYPFITSAQIVDNKMSLSSVPFSGADLELHSSPPQDAWPFMAQGQLLTMEVTGATQSGSTSIVVRNALPVTATELQSKKITEKLPKAFLSTLKRNETFTLKAKVSFNGGETYFQFRDSTPTLVD